MRADSTTRGLRHPPLAACRAHTFWFWISWGLAFLGPLTRPQELSRTCARKLPIRDLDDRDLSRESRERMPAVVTGRGRDFEPCSQREWWNARRIAIDRDQRT